MAKPQHTIMVRRDFSTSEINIMAKEQNSLLNRINTKDNEKKAYVQQITSEKAKLQAQANELGQKVSNGYELIETRVYIRKNFLTGVKEFIDVRTGFIVDSIMMTTNEMQGQQISIEDITEAAKPIENEKELVVQLLDKQLEAYKQKWGLAGLDIFKDERNRVISLLIGELYDADTISEGTDFDVAFDAVGKHFDNFVFSLETKPAPNEDQEAESTTNVDAPVTPDSETDPTAASDPSQEAPTEGDGKKASKSKKGSGSKTKKSKPADQPTDETSNGTGGQSDVSENPSGGTDLSSTSSASEPEGESDIDPTSPTKD